MFEVQLFIPVRDNEGRAFDRLAHEIFEKKARSLFGGITLVGQSQGSWENGAGRVFRDVCRVYVVAVNGLGAASSAVSLAREAKTLFRQEAIYIRYLGLCEIVS